jgi:hypoxanthine phosphoribosyltransferase
LKPYGLREEVTGNVLIIDDVSTSGKHVELATNALKPFCKYSTAVVWVAD